MEIKMHPGKEKLIIINLKRFLIISFSIKKNLKNKQ